MTLQLLKRCSRKEKCVHEGGAWQPATADSFPRNKSKKDGFNTQCKACTKAYRQSEEGRAAAQRGSAKYRAKLRSADSRPRPKHNKNSADQYADFTIASVYKFEALGFQESKIIRDIDFRADRDWARQMYAA
jgi:hypothetical protein